MDLESILLNKDKFTISRVKKNCYKMVFGMENNNIILSKVLDFNLLTLIYQLNPDVYEKVDIEHLNDHEVVATILLKHLFEDLGQSQRFSFIHMHKYVEHNKIIFKTRTIKNQRPKNIPEGCQLFDIQETTNIFNIVTPHKVEFTFNIVFDPSMNIPAFFEKVISEILYKIFKRVKLFIENIRI